MATVRDITEFGLIDRLARMVAAADLTEPSAGDFRLHLGIGDDAAAWRVGQGFEIWTTDTMVEGVHFTQQTTPWSDVGWKLLVANLSDIAAMGAAPLYTVVTLGLPPDTPVQTIDDLYSGMIEACHKYRMVLVGGDITSSPVTFITASMTGVCTAEPLTRTAARPGDAVAVTGPLGAPAGGLALLEKGARPASDVTKALIHAHQRPNPRLEEGQRLLRAGIRCAMDVSDGLVADLSKLCMASGVSALLNASQVPAAPGLHLVLPDQAQQLTLAGGEEYELLFTGPAYLVERVLIELPNAAVIGSITPDQPGRVVVLDEAGEEIRLETGGWEHLR